MIKFFLINDKLWQELNVFVGICPSYSATMVSLYDLHDQYTCQ